MKIQDPPPRAQGVLCNRSKEQLKKIDHQYKKKFEKSLVGAAHPRGRPIDDAALCLRDTR